MNPKEAKNLLKIWLENEIDISLCFIGSMGIGKSWIPRELAEEMGVGYDGIFPSQMGDGSEMTGIPYRQGKKQKWSIPENIPSKDKEYSCRLCLYSNVVHNHKKGYYVIDELNTAPIDIRNAMMEFLLSGSIHRNKMCDGWTRVVCMNPETEGYQVEALSKALRRRMLLIKLEPDYDNWRNGWAEGKINKDVLSFLDSHKDMLFKKETFSIEQEYNPDSYRMLSKIIDKLPWESLEVSTKMEIIQGLCGKEVAVSWIQFFKTNIKPIEAKELFSKYSELKERFIFQRNDLLSTSMEDVIDYINKKKEFNKSESYLICDLLGSLSSEHQVNWITKMKHEVKQKIHDSVCNIDNCKEKKENKEKEQISEEVKITQMRKSIVDNPTNPFNIFMKIWIKISELEEKLNDKNVKDK